MDFDMNGKADKQLEKAMYDCITNLVSRNDLSLLTSPFVGQLVETDMAYFTVGEAWCVSDGAS